MSLSKGWVKFKPIAVEGKAVLQRALSILEIVNHARNDPALDQAYRLISQGITAFQRISEPDTDEKAEGEYVPLKPIVTCPKCGEEFESVAKKDARCPACSKHFRIKKGEK